MVDATAAIEFDSLFKQSHANVFNLINTRSNVPDPNDASGVRKFVYNRIPMLLGRGCKAGYPFIVIPNVKVTQRPGSISATREFITYDVEILIYSQDKDSDSSGNAQGAETLDTVSDNVVKTLNANRATLRNNGLAKFTITGGDTDLDEVEGKNTFVREMNLTFETRQKVTEDG